MVSTNAKISCCCSREFVIAVETSYSINFANDVISITQEDCRPYTDFVFPNICSRTNFHGISITIDECTGAEYDEEINASVTG